MAVGPDISVTTGATVSTDATRTAEATLKKAFIMTLRFLDAGRFGMVAMKRERKTFVVYQQITHMQMQHVLLTVFFFISYEIVSSESLERVETGDVPPLAC